MKRRCLGPFGLLLILVVSLPPSVVAQACATPAPGLAAWWPGDGNAYDIWGARDGTPANGVTWAPGKVGLAFSFDGVDDVVYGGPPSIRNIQNTFTIEFWVFPKAGRAATPEANSGISGGGQRFAVGPEWGGTNGQAGVGVSVGTNGISVFEHAADYLPSRVVWDAALTNWTHVAVVYNNKQPKLYVNGVLARVGLPSPRSFVFPSKLFGNTGDYGPFSGLLDEIAIFDRALTAPDINAIYQAGSAGMCKPTEAKIVAPRLSGALMANDSLRFAGQGTDSRGSDQVKYLWSFTGGQTSTLQNPGLFTFTSSGSNLITLDVLDDQGQHARTPDSRTITVIPDTNAVPDLAVAKVSVPANLAMNQTAQITFSVTNTGDGTVSGKSWKDALYLSRDQYLDVNDRLLVSASVSNNVPVNGGYTNTLTAAIPTVEEGVWYLIISIDDEWQILERHQLNNEFAVATDLVIPWLTNNVPLAGRLTGDGDEQYFRIDVSAGQNSLIGLRSADSQGANELYVRFGALPTRGTFDYRAATPGTADQQLLIPASAPGTYYILVRGESVLGSGQFTLQTTAATLQVTAVTPGRLGQSASATLTVAGAGFDATVVADLVSSGGAAYRAASVSADSFTQLTAAFDLTGVPVGVYSLRVSSSTWGTNGLADAFEVLPAGEPKLETSLVVPSQLGYHAVATLYVEYRNTGNATMPAPLLVLTANQNGREGAFLTLQPTRLVEGFWTSADPEGFSHSIQILASGRTPGVLQPGESVRLPVYYAGWQKPWDLSYPAFNFNLGILKADDSTAADWSSLKTSMKPGSISAEAWDTIWASFALQVGNSWGDYVRMLDDNAAYLGRLGQRVIDIGQLLAFELLQADGLNPLRILASAVDASVEAPGLPLVFSRSFPGPISQRSEVGPFGRGWSHNWQYSLQKAADGTVTILGPGGSRRTFQPDSRTSGSYFFQAGDHATLAPLGGGAFSLREPGGLLRAFRADGRLDYIQDLNGNRITAGYSGDQLASLTHSSGQSLQILAIAGHVGSITDHLGRQTTFTYDGDHLTGAQYYDGRTATYDYSLIPNSTLRMPQLTSVANSCCTRRYFSYDAQGRVNRTHTEGNAESLTFTYDGAGKVTATDALGNSSSYHFDHRGLLAKTEDAFGNAVHRAFDDAYNLVRLTDPAGRSYNYAYDVYGNLTRTTDPLGHVSRFTYHTPLNRLASVTDANANTTRYAYTSSGNLESIVYADGSREGWAYDPLGNATTWTNRRSHPIGYTYNTSGLLTTKLFADGSRAEYAYDSRGNLTNATTLDSGLATVEFSVMSYDVGDRLTNIVFTGGKWLAFTYDTAGRRASSLDQLGHRLTYAYDTAGRLQSMTNELAECVVRYEYDSAGRLALKTLGNGMFAIYGYDAAGQLLTLTNRLADGIAISWFNYTYDTRGRRTAMATHYGTWGYEYDDLGQLTRAVLTSTEPEVPSQDLTYVYDALGNRIRTVENGVSTEYTANNLNQYVHVADTSYAFDADGNLIQEIAPSGTMTYTYSDENRLVGVTSPQGTWQYGYDGLGNRVTTTENGVTNRFVIDPVSLGNVVDEYDGTGSLIGRYDHGLGLLSRTDAGGDPSWYSFDAIGNAQQLVTSAGTIANAYAYAPFGALLRRTEAIPNPFQFVGQFGVMKEASGPSLMRSRTFLPRIGRFCGTDPLRISGKSRNSYLYASNDPNRFIDPMGMDDLEVWVGGFGSDAANEYFARELQGYQQVFQPFRSAVGWWLSGFEFVKPHTLSEGTSWGAGLTLGTSAGAGCGVGVGVGLIGGIPTAIRFDCSAEVFTGLELSAGYGTFQGLCIVCWSPPTSPGGSGSGGSPRPVDPNAKSGPAGFGTNGFIGASGTLPYRIDFENMTNASGPAQQVVITDQLNGNLDWSAFRLAEVGFGDQLGVVPPNSQHFETNLTATYLGTTFEVQIEAGIHLFSGLIYANFRSIDPATSLPPLVNIGFLPPEDGTGRGQGHFSYTVSPKPGLPSGTEIRNVALISFDLQPAIATNQKDPHNPAAGTDPAKECLNTIDADAPSSAVAALPSEGDAEFTVTWSGTDDSSGVVGFDIYVSTNGAPWGIWSAGATNNSAVFEGVIGRTYGFASIARDGAGNVEALPSAADTQTKVVRDNRVPPLGIEVFEGFLGVYWQAPAQVSLQLESTSELGDAAVWTREEPDLATLDYVVWLFVTPDEQARFYRLRRQ